MAFSNVVIQVINHLGRGLKNLLLSTFADKGGGGSADVDKPFLNFHC